MQFKNIDSSNISRYNDMFIVQHFFYLRISKFIWDKFNKLSSMSIIWLFARNPFFKWCIYVYLKIQYDSQICNIYKYDRNGLCKTIIIVQKKHSRSVTD